MRQILCSELVGREEQLAELAEAVAASRTGHGSAFLVMGEAGVGKSRLTREVETLARQHGFQVLRGRAVDASTEPYRPIVEAVLSGLRASGPPDVPVLRPFRRILGRLLPAWREENAQPSDQIRGEGDDSVVLLGEALLRLLHVLAAGRGCLLVLEDLHWADADSLAVIEYLIDNLSSEPVLLLGTIRSDEQTAGLEQARRIGARRAAHIVTLPRLDRDSIETMARLCLASAVGAPADHQPYHIYPTTVIDFLTSYSEGLPFLVEELLAVWIESGLLVRTSNGWEVPEHLPPVAPLTFADTVTRRLTTLGNQTVRLLEAAAILGPDFDWTLLPAATGLGGQDVLDRLRAALEAQLLVTDAPEYRTDQAPFRFRHALTRSTILARLLPPERAALSARLLTTVENTHPGLPGEWCDLAAGLAEAAGKNDHAAKLFLESGRRAHARGALATAESVLDRAGRLVEDKNPLSVEIMDSLMEALSLAGKWERVFEVGERLLQRLRRESAQDEEIGRVYLRMARAALVAARWQDASVYLESAHRHATDSGQENLLAQLDGLRAHLAIERARLDEARAFAESALRRAERTTQPDVACQALEVLGRCARVNDLEQAEAAFERALRIAEENGLTVWRLRALHELGTLDIFGTCRLDRLLEAHELAIEAGALATAAMVDIQIAAAHDNRSEFDAEIHAARRARETARRFHLEITEAAAFLFEGTANGHLGRRADMERALSAALDLAGDEPDIVAGAWEARAFASLTEDKREQALSELEMAIEATNELPATTPGPYRGLWALVRTMEGTGGTEVCEAVRRSGATILPINHGYVTYAEAITLARSGRKQEASAAVARAGAGLTNRGWFRYVGLRLVAEVAIQDGWGEPVTWLWDAFEYFNSQGYDRLASTCAALLRRAGAVVPTRRSYSGVPARFRALGITRREMEVLSVVGEGLSNREIGQRLFLSPRTVEKHIASLLAKTGARGRAQLAALAVSDTVPAG